MVLSEEFASLCEKDKIPYLSRKREEFCSSGIAYSREEGSRFREFYMLAVTSMDDTDTNVNLAGWRLFEEVLKRMPGNEQYWE